MNNEIICPMDAEITVDLEGYLQDDPSAETVFYSLDGEEE